MPTTQAHVSTPNATSYLRQLCRHWAHRFPVTFDDQHGRIELPSALCLLSASPEALEVQLDLQEGADEPRLQQVVAEHLQRFGFREELRFNWQPAPGGGALTAS